MNYSFFAFFAAGVISFTELARQVADQWKVLDADQKRLFEERADEEKAKYAVELEEWLLSQVPTPQIKKRLSALRRGSLGKFVSSKRKTPPSPSPSPSRPSTTPSSYAPSYSHSSFVAPAQAVVAPKPSPFGDGKRTRQQIQLERARNLQRLYQMQIDLYNEQMRLHEECKQELPPMTMNSYESTTRQHHHHFHEHEDDRFYDHHHHHGMPEMGLLQETCRFVSTSELCWDQQHAVDPIYDDHQFAPHHHHHHSPNQGYDMPVQSPFHDHIDGRVSPFDAINDYIA